MNMDVRNKDQKMKRGERKGEESHKNRDMKVFGDDGMDFSW